MQLPLICNESNDGKIACLLFHCNTMDTSVQSSKATEERIVDVHQPELLPGTHECEDKGAVSSLNTQKKCFTALRANKACDADMHEGYPLMPPVRPNQPPLWTY